MTRQSSSVRQWLLLPKLLFGLLLGWSWVVLASVSVDPQPVTVPAVQALRSNSAFLPQRAHVITGMVLSIPAQPSVDAVLSSRKEPIVSRGMVATTRVSHANDGGEINAPALDVAMGADGRTVLFSTRAGNLVAADTNDYEDIYLADLETGDTLLISQDGKGNPGDSWSGGPALSADGRYVAFFSWAGNLVEGDTNAVQDVFVYERETANLVRVSVATDGAQANDRSGGSSPGSRPAISTEGRTVAFHSLASNLVADDTNGVEDVFVHDLARGTTTRLSVSAVGVEGNGPSSNPALSAGGRIVVYQSRATNLTAQGTAAPVRAGTDQIYLHDSSSGETWLISTNLMGLPGNGDSTAPSISGDGRFVVFQSAASDLVDGDTNGSHDIFLYDVLSQKITRISTTSAGAQGNHDSTLPVISPDGGHIAFVSRSSNLVDGDTNASADIFVHNRMSRHTSRVSMGVIAPWTGEGANGDSYGPPALMAGGRLVAYISAATNLVADDQNGVADIFVHERLDPPAYTVSGRVLDTGGHPLDGVRISLGPHHTVSAGNGEYTVPNVVGGTYTIVVAKPEHSFSPARRTVSVFADVAEQNFAGQVDGGLPEPFLNLPLRRLSGSPLDAVAFSQALHDTEDGGGIDAWFDHDLPDYSKNGAVALWDGRGRTTGSYNLELGCYERRCYDGHDGFDFPYRDPDPETKYLYEPVPIYPAAAGLVVGEYTSCGDGDRWCNGGYGNEVIVDHGNGYLTRYAHLARVDVPHSGDGAPYVLPVDVLGIMGSTGNSFGTHLHFAVHRDDGNHGWDGPEVDRPVDPFGWAGAQLDPWVLAGQGPVSRWLWLFSPNRELTLSGGAGGQLEDGTGAIMAKVPPGAFAGQATLELVLGAPAGPTNGSQRSLGRAFWLRVLEWVPEGEQMRRTATSKTTEDAVLAQPVTIDVDFAGIDTRHLDLSHAILSRWDSGARQWRPLPTQVDANARRVHATSAQLGNFDLQAPLLCPGDGHETDDSYYTAAFVQPSDGPALRLFDVVDDEDWFRLEAVGGRAYRITTEQVAGGAIPHMEIYDVDGLTLLADGPGDDDGPTSQLSWQPTRDGTYFIRISPAPGSAVGCAATYTLRVE